MYLQKIAVLNFKNYHETEVLFCKKVNCFVGNNGVGKTNLLDAIHYLSFCKSFLNPIDSQNIFHNEHFFIIQGNYLLDGNEEEIYCGQKRSQRKQFKRNKKEYDKLADHIGLIPLVVISPSDGELIYEGSELRRKTLDSILSQLDRNYLNNLINYNRILQHRNALIKRMSETRIINNEDIEVWNLQMVELGERIHEKRKKFIDAFNPVFQKLYELISDSFESVSINYNSQLNEENFTELLIKSFNKDLRLQYSSVGIHKDDLEFLINDYPVKKFGSQGQQKSFLIALKLAQFEFISKSKNLKPILLLDDIYDKLDEKRILKLMELIKSDNFGQIFITDTHEERLFNIFNSSGIENNIFKISNGTIQLINLQYAQ